MPQLHDADSRTDVARIIDPIVFILIDIYLFIDCFKIVIKLGKSYELLKFQVKFAL